MSRGNKRFQGLLSRQREGSGDETLASLQTVIFELSPDASAWKEDTRERAYVLLQMISKRLDDPAAARDALGLLYRVLSRGGPSAVEMARPILRGKIESMYHAPRYRSERFLPRLLLMLDDYRSDVVCSVTSDAIHVWGDDQFHAASGFLGSRELDQRGLKSTVKEFLGREIAKAGDRWDKAALTRAVELYFQVG